MPSTCLSRENSLLAITCLKRTADGELCAEERLVLLGRLMHIDSHLAGEICRSKW